MPSTCHARRTKQDTAALDSERALSISRRIMRARFAAVVAAAPVGAVAVPEAILSDGLLRDQLSDGRSARVRFDESKSFECQLVGPGVATCRVPESMMHVCAL